MAAEMNSRDRILAALNLEEPDRVPIAMRNMEPLNHLWKDRYERARILRDRFGIDDFLHQGLTWVYDSSVEEKTEWREWEEKGYPMLATDYHTPAGTLHAEVTMTEDYHTERLQLSADQLMPRMLNRPIKEREDVARFRYLLGDPARCDLSQWDEEMSRMVEFGRSEGFPIGFHVPAASDIALKNVGPTEMSMGAMDGDPMVDELLEALTEWGLQWIDYGARFGADIVYYSAVYETTNFWSPTLFRNLFAPIQKKLAQRAHDHGMKYINYVITGVDGLTEEYKGLGIDALYGFDPVPPGDADMGKLKRVLGPEMALWGGLSPTWTVERGSEEDVRNAVREAIEILAPGGGFILCPGGSVYFEELAGLGAKKWDGKPEDSRAYRNLMTLFEAGLEYGKYPLKF